jgi:uncharacterized membrane protein
MYVEQAVSLRRPLTMWLIVATGSLLLVAMIVGAPLADASGHSALSFVIYRAFSYVCHQLPERSYFIAEHQFAVCSRCTGLYFGFTAATLVYPLLRSLRTTTTPARKWLFLAAAPLGVDFLLGYLNIWENTHTSRLFTGLLLGAVSVFYVVPGFVDLSLRLWRKGGAPAQYSKPTRTTSDLTPSAPSDYSAPHLRI